MKPRMKPKTFSIRRNPDKTLDEVLAYRPRFVHLEQMDTDQWWLRIDINGKYAVVVNFWTGKGDRKGAAIKARAELD